MKQILLLLIALSLTNAGQAQPDPNNAPKGINPTPPDQAALNKAAAEKAMDEGRKAAEKVMAMTPAQQREFLLSLQKQMFGNIMTQNGFNDLELQDTLWKFQIDQNTARNAVRLQAARLRQALSDKKSTDAAAMPLLRNFLDAVEAERARYKTAVDELRADLKLDAHPRLNALLQLYGVLGDGSWFLAAPLTATGSVFMLPSVEELAALDAKK